MNLYAIDCFHETHNKLMSKIYAFNEGLLENLTMNFTVASAAICIPFLGIIGSADPPPPLNAS